MIKFIITIIIVAVIFFAFSVFGVNKKTDGDFAGFVPGDVLYSLDKFWEWLELNILTISEDKKVKLEIKFMDERLAELQKLQKKKELTQKKAQRLMNDYNNLVDKIDNDIKKAKEAKKNIDEFLLKIKEITKKHQGIIEGISEDAPQKTSNIIDNISNWGEKSFNKLKNISE